MRLDEGRHHQIAAGIEVIRAKGWRFGLPGDAADQTVFKVQFVQTFLVAQTGVDDVHQANPFYKSCSGAVALRAPSTPVTMTYVSAAAAIPTSGATHGELNAATVPTA
ncbi:hypothetical protein D3C72_703940 [compost metagenome]